MVLHTCERMAAGGIHDQLGGGFSRYSVDAAWLVPHFEKMLYDNALLARVYVEAYQVTKKPLYRHVAGEVIEYVIREMTDAVDAAKKFGCDSIGVNAEDASRTDLKFLIKFGQAAAARDPYSVLAPWAVLFEHRK